VCEPGPFPDGGGLAEGDRIEAAVVQAQGQLEVRIADDALALDAELVDEQRRRESLAPDAGLDRLEQGEVDLGRGEGAIVERAISPGWRLATVSRASRRCRPGTERPEPRSIPTSPRAGARAIVGRQ